MDNNQANGAQQPVPPQQPAVNPAQPISNNNVPPATPGQQPVDLKTGLRNILSILCLLFFIPAMFVVFYYYGKFKQAALAGNTVAADKYLKTMKLWGYIAPAVGFIALVIKISSGGK